MGAQFAPNVPQVQKSFWMHMMELLGDVGHVDSRFGTVLVSVQGRCTICTKCTTGSEIGLDAHDRTAR
jgi:hypothetical protein